MQPFSAHASVLDYPQIMWYLSTTDTLHVATEVDTAGAPLKSDKGFDYMQAGNASMEAEALAKEYIKELLQTSAPAVYLPMLLHAIDDPGMLTSVKVSHAPAMYLPMLLHGIDDLGMPTSVNAPALYMPMLTHVLMTQACQPQSW